MVTIKFSASYLHAAPEKDARGLSIATENPTVAEWNCIIPKIRNYSLQFHFSNKPLNLQEPISDVAGNDGGNL
jgi:hypothetical protein